MKVAKSLQEVWDWKDAIYEKTKHMTMAERIDFIKERAAKVEKERNLHLRKAESPIKSLTK